MITDQDIANLCADIYLPAPQAGWTQLVLPDDGIAYGIKDFGTAVALVFRGSSTLTDWLRDAETIADPFEHAELGPVHPGFFEGLPELWAQLKPETHKKALHRCRSQSRGWAGVAFRWSHDPGRYYAVAALVLW